MEKCREELGGRAAEAHLFGHWQAAQHLWVEAQRARGSGRRQGQRLHLRSGYLPLCFRVLRLQPPLRPRSDNDSWPGRCFEGRHRLSPRRQVLAHWSLTGMESRLLIP